jgi:NAD-dependent deacetylase
MVPTMQAMIAQAAQHLRKATHLVVLTGAGISKESGLPTFRDAQEGLWAAYDPQELATPAAFQRNPKLVWEWYEHRRQMLSHVHPNAGHHALVALEALVPNVTVITQNVDGLHHAAGSRDVIALHGDITQHKCFADCQGQPTLIDLATLTWDVTAGPPACPQCGAHVRPNVVWFNEVLPTAALERAQQLCQICDVLLVVGTSGMVQPAAQLPYRAKRWGRATVIDVNPVLDEIAPLADIFLQGKAGEVLPALVAAANSLVRND